MNRQEQVTGIVDGFFHWNPDGRHNRDDIRWRQQHIDEILENDLHALGPSRSIH